MVVVGRLYEHAGARQRPAVLVLTGASGGIDFQMAPWVASQGYNVLSLGYFNATGLPADLLELPREYFVTAIEWLAKRHSTRDVSVVGGSLGAEAALLIGSYYPDRVRVVVAWMPTHVVWEGIDARARFGGDSTFASPGKSRWSLNGKPLPFVRKFISAARLEKLPAASGDQYAPQFDQPIDPAVVYLVERIRGPVFLVGAGDDLASAVVAYGERSPSSCSETRERTRSSVVGVSDGGSHHTPARNRPQPIPRRNLLIRCRGGRGCVVPMRAFLRQSTGCVD